MVAVAPSSADEGRPAAGSTFSVLPADDGEDGDVEDVVEEEVEDEEEEEEEVWWWARIVEALLPAPNYLLGWFHSHHITQGSLYSI